LPFADEPKNERAPLRVVFAGWVAILSRHVHGSSYSGFLSRQNAKRGIPVQSAQPFGMRKDPFTLDGGFVVIESTVRFDRTRKDTTAWCGLDCCILLHLA